MLQWRDEGLKALQGGRDEVRVAKRNRKRKNIGERGVRKACISKDKECQVREV